MPHAEEDQDGRPEEPTAREIITHRDEDRHQEPRQVFGTIAEELRRQCARPSNWPIGSRFIAVASNPTHAARATGCSTRSRVETPGNCAHSTTRRSRGVPNTTSPSHGLPWNHMGEGYARRSTAGSMRRSRRWVPAMPISKRICFDTMADRIRMNAPNVPGSTGTGRK